MNRIILLLLLMFVFSGVSLASPPLFKTGSSYVDSVVERMNAGDRAVLRTISYRDINFVLDYKRTSDRGGYSFFRDRGKVVNSALKGLFNSDPRVRLLCVELLLFLEPDRLMEPEVSLAYSYSRDFVISSSVSASANNDYYTYRDLSGKERSSSMSGELSKLYKFVLRDKFLFIMLKRDSRFLQNISKSDFLILSEEIHDEASDSVPLKSYGTKKFISVDNLRVIIYGLENPSIDVSRSCADYLVNYYNNNVSSLSLYYRNLILRALKKAYKDDVIKKPNLVKYGSSAANRFK